jgi:hypothetical protein
MPKYSRSHERAERAKMARGLWESLFGLIFCWLPGVGLILAVAGFFRQAVRLTEVHRARRFFYMLFASLVLIVAIGVLVGEAYLYSRDPDITDKAGLWLWQKVTGQQALPGAGEYGDMPIEEYLPDDSVPDEYYTDDGMIDGDLYGEEGDLYGEEGDLYGEEGDFRDDVDFHEDETDEPDAAMPSLSELLKSKGVAVG